MAEESPARAPESARLDAVFPAGAALLSAVQWYESALAAPEDTKDWHERVARRLDGLSRAFDDHVAVTEGPDGRYAAMVQAEPHLLGGTQTLISDHATIRAAIDSLIAAGTSDPTQHRALAVDLLRRLNLHRQYGADLAAAAVRTAPAGHTHPAGHPTRPARAG